MSVADDLLDCAKSVAARAALPALQALHVPAPREDAGIEGEFGLVVLADGSAGLFFALLGDTLARLQHELRGAAGRSPLALAEGIVSPDPVERAVALGAIAALTRFVFHRAGYSPPAAANAAGGGTFSPSDHVGMVGLFPSLASRLRAQRVPLTVLELKPEKVVREDRFEVTLDPGRLRDCNRILCTASTIINGTLEALLAQVPNAEHVAVIGPSAGCFPDPLLARGVHAVGGAQVMDAQGLAARIMAAERWGDAVRRHVIGADGYPGLDRLLGR